MTIDIIIIIKIIIITTIINSNIINIVMIISNFVMSSPILILFLLMLSLSQNHTLFGKFENFSNEYVLKLKIRDRKLKIKFFKTGLKKFWYLRPSPIAAAERVSRLTHS